MTTNILPLPCLAHMPEHIKEAIIKMSDVETRQSLEQTCYEMRHLSMDRIPHRLDRVRLEMFKNGTACIWTDDGMQKTGAAELVIGLLGRLLGHRKSTLRRLEVDLPVGQLHNEAFVSALSVLKEQLYVEELSLQYDRSQKTLVDVLGMVRAGSLRAIGLHPLGDLEEILHLDEAARLEQWRGARRLEITNMPVIWELANFAHFNELEITLGGNLSVERFEELAGHYAALMSKDDSPSKLNIEMELCDVVDCCQLWHHFDHTSEKQIAEGLFARITACGKLRFYDEDTRMMLDDPDMDDDSSDDEDGSSNYSSDEDGSSNYSSDEDSDFSDEEGESSDDEL